jgi:hypothetical protein
MDSRLRRNDSMLPGMPVSFPRRRESMLARPTRSKNQFMLTYENIFRIF